MEVVQLTELSKQEEDQQTTLKVELSYRISCYILKGEVCVYFHLLQLLQKVMIAFKLFPWKK